MKNVRKNTLDNNKIVKKNIKKVFYAFRTANSVKLHPSFMSTVCARYAYETEQRIRQECTHPT